MRRQGGFTIVEGLIVAWIGAVLCLVASYPYFEARTFNKFSAKKATYWDAVFADLRIIAEK